MNQKRCIIQKRNQCQLDALHSTRHSTVQSTILHQAPYRTSWRYFALKPSMACVSCNSIYVYFQNPAHLIDTGVVSPSLLCQPVNRRSLRRQPAKPNQASDHMCTAMIGSFHGYLICLKHLFRSKAVTIFVKLWFFSHMRNIF